MGPYINSFREDFIISELFLLLNQFKIIHNNIHSVSKLIGNPFQIQDWIINGLPSDNGSIDNAVILFETNKQTLIIDPQKQAYKFIEKLHKADFVLYKKTEDSIENFKNISYCIKHGRVLIFDYISYDIPSEAEPLLNMDIININNVKHINLNENFEVPLHENFKTFFISYLTNPSFNPELYGKISIINFSVTKSGLVQQLLSVIVNQEAPAEEIERINILQKQFLLNETMNKMENEILEKLNVSNQTLLDNDSLIISLEESKRLSDEAGMQIISAKQTEERIDRFRMSYYSLAKIGMLIFFCFSEMYYVEEIYQFSITWFINDNLIKSIKNCVNVEKGNLERRVNYLKKNLLITAYHTICRSLLNKDKILLSFLLLLRIYEEEGKITIEEMRFLFSDRVNNIINNKNNNDNNNDNDNENDVSKKWFSKFSEKNIIDIDPEEIYREMISKKPDFIDKIKWDKIVKLNTLKDFKGIYEDFLNNQEFWKNYNEFNIDNKDNKYKDKDNNNINSELNNNNNEIFYINSINNLDNFPSEFLNDLFCIKKLLIIKIFHPDKLIFYIKKYITELISEKLSEIPVYNLSELLELSCNSLPLMLLMTPGLDPSNDLKKLSEEYGKELITVSLGQGQSERAIKNIKFCQDKGHWVYLQNLHLVNIIKKR
jgi:dynein heavy chain